MQSGRITICFSLEIGGAGTSVIRKQKLIGSISTIDVPPIKFGSPETGKIARLICNGVLDESPEYLLSGGHLSLG